jgi:hypothetical protein
VVAVVAAAVAAVVGVVVTALGVVVECAVAGRVREREG